MRGAERRWRELSGEAVRNKMRGGGSEMHHQLKAASEMDGVD